MKYNRNVVAATAGFVAMVAVGYVHAVSAAPAPGAHASLAHPVIHTTAKLTASRA